MKPTKFLLRCAPVALALGAGLIFIPAGRAQSGLQASDNRFLFIFDTSADMKKRLPAMKMEMDQLLSTSMGGQLRSGNSIGVWTFDQNLRTGQFPQLHWRADEAADIGTSINKFLGAQHYANKTRFDALQPSLNQVIQNSVRLTVLIFCDGEDNITWTPYAEGVNQAFQQRLAEQKRAKQPFVLVLRTQLGNYVGCTMNFPPGMVNLPDFPPLPPPPAPVVKTSPPPVVKPPPPVTPLVIVGTKIYTNWPPPVLPAAPAPIAQPTPAAPTNVAPATTTNPVATASPPAPTPAANPAPATPTNLASSAPANPVTPEAPITPPVPANPLPSIQTNAAPPPSNPPAPATPGQPTRPNPVAVQPIESAAVTATNATTSPEKAGADHEGMILISGALLVVAGALAVFAWVRSRRSNHGSLITRSMRKD